MNGETINNEQDIFKPITTFIFDVDGVFTDSTVILDDSGIYHRSYHTRDGFGVRFALQAGYSIWVITGGKGNSIEQRFRYLGVDEIHTNISDNMSKSKHIILQQLMEKYQRQKEQLCYMGDDIPDVLAMQLCGLRTCPADACDEVLKSANYISPYLGGMGCVRDIIEQVLKAQGKWKDFLEKGLSSN